MRSICGWLVGMLWGCAGAIEPLPVGSGTFFTEQPILFSSSASFIQVDELTGGITWSESGVGGCDWLFAMDAGPDGVVMAVGGEQPTAHLVDPRSPSRCQRHATLPAVMHTLAVHPDGRVFTVSDEANVLHVFDADMALRSTVPVSCPDLLTCALTGMDFAPDGALYAITFGSTWGRLDPETGVFTRLADIGLRDDFDIDPDGLVRGMTSGELRTFDLAGVQQAAVNVENGTTFATGVVRR